VGGAFFELRQGRRMFQSGAVFERDQNICQHPYLVTRISPLDLQRYENHGPGALDLERRIESWD